MRRSAIVVFSFLLVVLVLAYFVVPSHAITVTQEQINDTISDRLPLEVEQTVGRAVLQGGLVTLSAGDHVSTEWEMEVVSPVFEGSVSISAALQLHYENGRFYLKDLNYEEVQIAFLRTDAPPEETVQQDLGDLLVQGLASALQSETGAAVDPSRPADPAPTNALKQLLGACQSGRQY